MNRKAAAGTKTRPLFVRAEWDEDARVWVATSDDVPGLATEAPSLDGLTAKLKIMIPELLALNQTSSRRREVAFELLSRRFETVQLAGWTMADFVRELKRLLRDAGCSFER